MKTKLCCEKQKSACLTREASEEIKAARCCWKTWSDPFKVEDSGDKKLSLSCEMKMKQDGCRFYFLSTCIQEAKLKKRSLMTNPVCSNVTFFFFYHWFTFVFSFYCSSLYVYMLRSVLLQHSLSVCTSSKVYHLFYFVIIIFF